MPSSTLDTAVLTIINPATGEPVGEVETADAETVDIAVRMAHQAFGDWSRRGYSDRGKLLHACAEAFEAHVDELVPILVSEQGKTIREAQIELHKAAETLEHYAGLAKEVRGVYVHGLDPGVDGRVLRRPLGVVARSSRGTSHHADGQQNWPAMAVGNTVVVKPADTTPFTTLRLHVMLKRILPEGVFNVVTGTGPVTGEELVTNPLVRKVGFTGRPRPASRRARAAAGSKRTTLELGGSDPMIMCDDADLKMAARPSPSAASTTRPGMPGDQARLRARQGGRQVDRGDRGESGQAGRRPGRRPEVPDRSDAHRPAAGDHGVPDRRRRAARSRRRHTPRWPGVLPRADGRGRRARLPIVDRGNLRARAAHLARD